MESRLLLAAQTPLCLDPSIDVACVNNRMCYNQLKFSSNSVQQYLRRRSHANRNNKASNITGIAHGLLGLHSRHRKVLGNVCLMYKYLNVTFISGY